MDVDERRLDMTYRMAGRLAGELQAGLTFSKTTDRAETLQCADCVINTAQVGGHAWTTPFDYMKESGWVDDYILVPFGFDQAEIA
jgi:alpha-galactosidase/6-phospho-beta-glucosidase family protein